MHPTILAKRQLDAQNRIVDAAQLLAERFGVEPPNAIQERQTDVAQMLRWEAVAKFLEALAFVERGVKLEDILAIEGLSKTSVAKIKEAFGGENEDA